MRFNITFENPDCLTPEQLREHVRMLRHLRHREPDEDNRRHIDTLMSYCRIKAESWEEREAGNIEAALALERVGEKFYNRLPEFLRW